MRLCALLVLTLLATPAAAHHSLVGYDHARRVTLDGVVSEFSFTNPHPILTILVGSGAAQQPWRLEMDNLWELAEIGLTRDSFKPSDRVKVSGSPDRNAGRSMYLWSLDRASDGLHYEQVGSRPSVRTRPKS